MINQNEIEEAAKSHDDKTNVHDGYHDFKSGANWAIKKLKERSRKGFDAFWDDFGARQECIGSSDRYCDAKDGWDAATLAAEAHHGEELKKMEDRIERLRGALREIRDFKTAKYPDGELAKYNSYEQGWFGVSKYSGEALALDDQLKEGK